MATRAAETESLSLLSMVRREDWIIALLSCAIIMLCWLALMAVGSEANPLNSGIANIGFYYTKFAMVLVAHYAWLVWRERPESPIRFIYQGESLRALVPPIITSLVLVTAVALFMPAFTAMKSAIPLFNDYSWDATFIVWDQAIHGQDAWLLLQPVLGHPAITSVFTYLYHLWFMLIYFGPICVALYVSNREIRLRFFIGFLLTWTLVGIVGAIALASYGPVFLEPLTGDPRFAEQIAYLNKAGETHSILVLEVQRILLESFQQGEHGLGRGITAMPSMHVALAMLYFLMAREIDRRLGWAFLAFLIVIMLGSVHLAYHYAVDGYVSIVMTALIWWATRPLAQKILGKSSGSHPALQQETAPAGP